MIGFDLSPKTTWLFCMTHPDDEIFIITWIKRLIENGNKVYISWTHSNSIRKLESIQVGQLLKIPEEHLFFHEGTDGSIASEMIILKENFQNMIDIVKPDRIACGAFEQGHIDHDATNFLVSLCYQGPIFEIPFYHTYLTRFPALNKFSDSSNEEKIFLTKNEATFKKKAVKMYPSQNIARNVFAHEYLKKCFLKTPEFFHIERLRKQPDIDYSKPNHSNMIRRKLQNHKTWKCWINELSNFYKHS